MIIFFNDVSLSTHPNNEILSMTKQLLIILILLVPFSISGLSQTGGTDRESAGLVGPVKSVRIASVDYSGDKIKGEGFMKTDGDLVSYDQTGREVDRKPVSDFGAAMGTMSKKYDKNGLLSESIWVDPAGKPIENTVYSYAKSKIVQTDTYNGVGKLVEKIVNTWDSLGRLQQETYHDPVNPVAKTLYKYDGKNNPIEIAFFLTDGRKAIAHVGPCLGAHRVTYLYNEADRVTAKEVFEDDGSKKRWYRWSYDKRGNASEYISESPSSTVSFSYNYEFDLRGNWTKRIARGTSLEKGSTVFGNKPTPYIRTTVTSREINYY